MKVKISIEVPMEELQENMQEYKECNGEELSLLDAKRNYIDIFIADKSDYIDRDNITVCFI